MQSGQGTITAHQSAQDAAQHHPWPGAGLLSLSGLVRGRKRNPPNRNTVTVTSHRDAIVTLSAMCYASNHTDTGGQTLARHVHYSST